MSTYKKLTDVITVNQNNTNVSNKMLSYNNKDVYFALEDSDGKYEGNLTKTEYNISSDHDGCYAITENIAGSTKGTAVQIVYTVTKNDSENDRTITYKYNNTPLFKILQSGYKYFYFNKIEITSDLVNKSIYMIAIDNKFVNRITLDSTLHIPALNYTITQTLYYFYTLYNTTFNPSISTFTYISGGGDILGNTPKNNKYQQITHMLGKYDSATATYKRIDFINYRNQINYIGLFIKSGNNSYTRSYIIDFSKSSKYKVE